jgi:hypothetical protein
MDLVEKTENNHRHPWELSRSYSILNILKKDSGNVIYADIGAGDKFFASKLKSLNAKTIYAIDTAYRDIRVERDGIISLNDISCLKDGSVDFFIAMDVLEHIEDDKVFLCQVHRKLKTNGQILITVPAIQYIFSSHDIFLKHFRRYDKKNIKNKLDDKFIIQKCFYFYSSLLILRIILLLYERLAHVSVKNVGIGLWRYNNNPITRFFYYLLNVDFLLCKKLNDLNIHPLGLSLLIICKKS